MANNMSTTEERLRIALQIIGGLILSISFFVIWFILNPYLSSFSFIPVHVSDKEVLTTLISSVRRAMIILMITSSIGGVSLVYLLFSLLQKKRTGH